MSYRKATLQKNGGVMIEEREKNISEILSSVELLVNNAKEYEFLSITFSNIFFFFLISFYLRLRNMVNCESKFFLKISICAQRT